MNKNYVSDFEAFMSRFLEEHPQVLEEQRRNWQSFWEIKMDRSMPQLSTTTCVADDMYGFSWHAWHASTHPALNPQSQRNERRHATQ
jgi:hypothetical protein